MARADGARFRDGEPCVFGAAFAKPSSLSLGFEPLGSRLVTALRGVLNPKGICVIAGAPKNASAFLFTHMLAARVLSPFVSQRLLTFIAKINTEDLTFIRELMATGKVKPIIDKQYRVSEAAEALAYLEKGHARAKVVINFGI